MAFGCVVEVGVMMAQGWTAVRVVRWPAQERDRVQCAARGLPVVVLVQDGIPLPAEGARERVLRESVSQDELADAVEELAWSAGSAVSAGEGGRSRRPRRGLGLVAALC